MATLTHVLAPASPAGNNRVDSSAGALAKGAQGDFAQLMSGAIEAQVNAPTSGARGASASTTPPKNASASSGITDTQAVLDRLQVKINTLLAQNPPLSTSAQQSLKLLQQQLAAMTASLGTSSSPTTQAVMGDKTLSDLQKQLDQLQTLLSQSDAAGSNWSTQLQAMALNLAQGLNPSSLSGAGLSGAAQTVMSASRDGVNQAGMAMSVKNNALTAQNNPTGALNHADGLMPTGLNANLAQGSSSAAQMALVGGALQGQNNASAVNQSLNVLIDQFNQTSSNQTNTNLGITSLGNAAQLTTAQANLSLSPPATDLTASLIAGLPTALPAAGFGSIATHSVWATLPGALDLNQAKMPSDLGQNIQWMLGKNISRATLDINPANLGPIKISIDQQRDQIQIQIMAAHHLTRDALDQAIPRLREWLQEAGLNQAGVTIGSYDAQSGQNPFLNQNQANGQAAGFGQSASQNAPGAAPTLEADNAKTAEGVVQKLTSVWRLDTFV
ncbi:MAG: hypothetical protein B7X12_07850 [Halothiobacillus sp. 20-53-49]|nr:flagellar hook-length control protein FliK [Halothiobacillaceae bacterium]OYV45713.1 MAG: hypothetical protein B7X12_07850 [Halothiobacillus sp. 20-53-49]HUM99880.1 flagellar hook-length control protein FliK [Halothiobacillus sp.]